MGEVLLSKKKVGDCEIRERYVVQGIDTKKVVLNLMKNIKVDKSPELAAI